MGELLVHTEHVAYLASTNTDITSRYVLVWTDVAIELRHECLAETHHLSVRLAARREVATTLGTTHRECGERVLEGLLEGEELQNAQVHRSVETDTALVRTNHVVVLDAVAHVGLHIALVVGPGHTELHETIGDAETLNEVCALKLRVFVVLFFDGSQHLAYGLDVLGFVGESLFQILNDCCCLHNLFTFKRV